MLPDGDQQYFRTLTDFFFLFHLKILYRQIWQEPKFGRNQNLTPLSVMQKSMEVYCLDDPFVITS